METLHTSAISSTPVSLIQKQGVAEANDYHHRHYSMNAIASVATNPTAPTMEPVFSSNYSDSTSTQPIQVSTSNHHSTKLTTKSNSLNDSNNITNSTSASTSTDVSSSFRRSHTCGSLFAKCGCSTPSPFDSLIPNDNNVNSATGVVSNDQVNYYPSGGTQSSTIQGAEVNGGTSKTNNINKSNQDYDRSENSDYTNQKRLSTKSTYVHPDIAFVFTDENKNPSVDPSNFHHDRSATITTKNGGKLQLRSHQRLSSPNIGNYAILDVAVHPEVVLKICTATDRPRSRHLKTSLSEDNSYCSSSFKRQQLQRSQREYHKSTDSDCSVIEPLTDSQPTVLISPCDDTYEDYLQDKYQHPNISDRVSESEHSTYDLYNCSDRNITDEQLSAKDDRNGRDVIDNAEAQIISNYSEYSQANNNNQQVAGVEASSSEICRLISPTIAAGISNASTIVSSAPVDPAQKYFQESGILGPLVNSSVTLIRKTSKIMQDANVIEHIRKNSKLLRQGGIYKDELEYTRNLIPNMKIDSEKKDQPLGKIKQLEEEILHLRDIIKARDNEIYKLKREIHKLKSVLQQTTNHMTIGADDLLSCNIQSPHHHDIIHKTKDTTPDSIINNCSNIKNANSIECNDKCHHIHHQQHQVSPDKTTCATNDDESSIGTSGNFNKNCKHLALECLENNNNLESTPCAINNGTNGVGGAAGIKNNHIFHVQHAAVKKQGVSGESSDPTNQQTNSVPIPKYKKDFRSKQLIKDAIMDNDFLKNIDSSQVRELVESMYSLEVAKGEYVIREGEVGAHLYVSAEGEFEVMKNGKVLGIMGSGKAFGELAILYNCTRTASIRCVTNARVWVLDRRVFQQIMMRTGMQRIEDNVNFLKSVPLLKNLSNEVLAKIADVLEVEFYPAGTYIIRQGASGDTFFLISQGTVKVTQRFTTNGEEKEIRTLNRGDYFGEQALINEDKRTANIIAMLPGVECLTLDRESFTHLIGDLCELKEKNYGDENRVLAMKFAETTSEVFGANVTQELQDVELNDLELVITLGIGGFGRVELVKCYRENRVETYALKCLKKKHILDTRQEEHVFSERTIMLSCNSPFICRLYRTFKDNKFVYMLLEACMGGEVWTILRDRGCFDENTAQFIIGCVLQAFEYLHSRGIIYRDLKPENLMLDERGYVKLVDFGFAKYIGQSSKTWTFCGTPEYVAPEIILNKGHDRAVDYWALGILIHELLNGTPPFTANDPMKTYNIILKGIDMVDFPKHMSRSAVMLIKRLCRDVPAERLGYQKGGIQDIKKHKWFQGFDWDGLADLTLIPPFLRPVSHSLDTSYFDRFPPDMEIPPDEESGWDEDF